MNTKCLGLGFLILLSTTVASSSDPNPLVPAFPGAEGYGAVRNRWSWRTCYWGHKPCRQWIRHSARGTWSVWGTHGRVSSRWGHYLEHVYFCSKPLRYGSRPNSPWRWHYFTFSVWRSRCFDLCKNSWCHLTLLEAPAWRDRLSWGWPINFESKWKCYCRSLHNHVGHRWKLWDLYCRSSAYKKYYHSKDSYSRSTQWSHRNNSGPPSRWAYFRCAGNRFVEACPKRRYP